MADAAPRATAKKYGVQWMIFRFLARLRGFGQPVIYEMLETI